MMGALHIEMSTLSALGAWLDDSGWTIALLNANVTTPDNQSLISGHEVAKTKYCHQVTACTLNSLMQEAYNHFREEKENISFGEWKSNMEERSPQFQFWSLTLKIELDYLLFVRSIRSRNFELYVLSIAKILPWLFALDHYHYARWLLIHLHDMQRLEQTDPQIHHEFCMKGHFVVSRRKNHFPVWASINVMNN